jgi:hypothetical protein
VIAADPLLPPSQLLPLLPPADDVIAAVTRASRRYCCIYSAVALPAADIAVVASLFLSLLSAALPWDDNACGCSEC